MDPSSSTGNAAVNGLADQIAEVQIDTSKLTALSPEVISRQATVGFASMQRRYNVLGSNLIH
jgi:hypothetical protein